MERSLWSEVVAATTGIGLAYQLIAVVAVLLLLVRVEGIRRKQLLHISLFYLLGVTLLIAGAAASSYGWGSGTTPRQVAILIMGLALIRIGGLLVFKRLLPLLQVQAVTILEDILVAIAYLVWCMVRLSEIGLDFSSIVTTSAVITAVLAFSLQDTLGNILGGTALQLDDSIHIGDWIKVDDVVGKVVDIRWRSTTVETRNWETVVIPNSVLMKGKFTILGRRSGEPVQWRRWVRFSIDFGTPPAQVVRTLEQALQRAEIPNVARHPRPNCVAMDLDDSVIHYAVRYWLTDLAVDDPTDSSVRNHIYAALKRAGIELAIPQQRFHMVKEGRKAKAHEHTRDIEQRIALMRSVDLFCDLSEEERRQIAERLTFAPFAEGDVITQQGAVAHWLYILVEGEVEVVLESDEGGQRRVSTLRGGETGSFFGEMGLLTGTPRAASVIAASDVVCYRLDKVAFESVIQARPELADAISQTMADRRANLMMAQHDLDQVARDRMAASDHEELLVKIRRFFGLDAAAS